MKYILPLCTIFAFTIFLILPALAEDDTSIDQQIAVVQAARDSAVEKVKAVVNQPVTHIPRTSDMRVSTYTPGWFHEGAIKPDFETVDIRKTQQLTYPDMYVTSSLNPGEVFMGRELEFNSMTKYFYTDYSLPKHRLSEAEMLYINQLYRYIAERDKEIEDLKSKKGFSFFR